MKTDNGYDTRRKSIRRRLHALSFKGVTRREVAEQMGVGESLLSHALSGRRSKLFRRLADDIESAIKKVTK